MTRSQLRVTSLALLITTVILTLAIVGVFKFRGLGVASDPTVEPGQPTVVSRGGRSNHITTVEPTLVVDRNDGHGQSAPDYTAFVPEDNTPQEYTSAPPETSSGDDSGDSDSENDSPDRSTDVSPTLAGGSTDPAPLAPGASPTPIYTPVATSTAIFVPDLGGRTPLVDATLGYSITYPSGWSVEPAVNPGAVTSISNYDPAMMPEEGDSSDDVPSGFTKIEIYTEGNPDNLPIDQWVKEKHQRLEDAFGPSAIEPTLRVVENSVHPAIESEIGGDSPALTRYIAVKSQVYILTTVSADVDPRPTFSSIADSFSPDVELASQLQPLARWPSPSDQGFASGLLHVSYGLSALSSIPKLVAPFDGTWKVSSGYAGDPSGGHPTSTQGCRQPCELFALDLIKNGCQAPCTEGLPIRAAHDGWVYVAEGVTNLPKTRLGRVVALDVDGQMKSGLATWYAHLLDIQVSINQRVKAGELIGHADHSGTDYPHLHFVLVDYSQEKLSIKPEPLAGCTGIRVGSLLPCSSGEGRDPAPQGGLRITEKLKISKTNPVLGETVEAQFKIKNEGASTVEIDDLNAGGRKGTDWTSKFDYSFPKTGNIRLKSGETYSYRQSRSYPEPGEYFAEPTMKLNGKWIGIAGANRVSISAKEKIPSKDKPAKPSDLQATVVDDSRIRLIWKDKSSNEDGFAIYVGGHRMASSGSNTTSMTLGGLVASTRYCLHILAFNSSGNSDASNEVCATTRSRGSGSPPAIPTIKRATECDGVTRIAVGQTVSTRWVGESKSYCFSGTPGWISIRLFSDDLHPTVRLYKGTQRLAENDNAPGDVEDSHAFMSVEITSSDLYRIEMARHEGTSLIPIDSNVKLRIDSGHRAAASDVNADCTVNSIDHALVAKRNGTDDPQADINLDGLVNGLDMSHVISMLQTRCR